MTTKTKSFSIRTDKELIDDFNKACAGLPISFRPRALIESYMKYIVDVEKEYEKTGDIKLGFISNKKGEIILYSENSSMNSVKKLNEK